MTFGRGLGDARIREQRNRGQNEQRRFHETIPHSVDDEGGQPSGAAKVPSFLEDATFRTGLQRPLG
jgi:hypothetical protein